MRKSFEISGLVMENDGVVERLYLKVHAINETKAKEFFKRDIANLKNCYEWQILNVRVER